MRIRQWLFLMTCVALGLALTARVFLKGHMSTALVEAVQHQASPRVIADLIARGANPNSVDRHNVPVLVEAAAVGPPETVSILLGAGASLNLRAPGGITPAIAASTSNILTPAQTRTILHILKQNGADLSERDQFGMTPFLRAVWSRNTTAAQTLLDLGADMHVFNYQNHGAWDFVRYGDPKTSGPMIKLLQAEEARLRQVHAGTERD